MILIKAILMMAMWRQHGSVSSTALLDLTVTGTATGTPSFINPSEANLPLTFTISNLGDATGTRFKLSIDVIDSSGRFVKPFYSAWYGR